MGPYTSSKMKWLACLIMATITNLSAVNAASRCSQRSIQMWSPKFHTHKKKGNSRVKMWSVWSSPLFGEQKVPALNVPHKYKASPRQMGIITAVIYRLYSLIHNQNSTMRYNTWEMQNKLRQLHSAVIEPVDLVDLDAWADCAGPPGLVLN